MNEDKFIVIGDRYNIFDYNLNNQFSNVKKIIITNEIILNSFKNSQIYELFDKISKSNQSECENLINEINFDSNFEENFNNEFYKIIQEKINLLTNEITNVKLENYNFMNSISNEKFNIRIKAIGFSKTIYFEEKGKILSIINNLIKDYLNFKLIELNTSQIKRFQIEIYKSEEIYKQVFLKKSSDSIILASTFGYQNNNPIDFQTGSEIYFSIGDDFKFYKNTQNFAILREHNKLENKEINLQEKILSNDELIQINKTTKDMQDLIIEMYINDKGKLRILNVNVLENSIYNKSEMGFFINKSENNYNSISLNTIRDNLEEESVNPKYLMIRNEEEVKELFSNLSMISKIDGIIFNCNFYNPILDYIGKKLNIDILFYNKELKKSLEVKLDRENFKIETGEDETTKNTNPFSNILNKDNNKDEFLEKLKNIDLNSNSLSNNSFNNFEKENISNVAQKIVSSQNSSINKANSNTFANMGDNSGRRKTAMEILAEAALNKDKKIEKPIQTKIQPNIDFSKSQIIEKNIKSEDLNKIDENNFNLNDYQNNNNQSEIETNSQIEEVKTIKIITTPQINSKCYFTDQSSISQVNEGEIYYLTTDTQNLSNSNLKFVIPISIRPITAKTYLLINSIDEFFLIDTKLENEYFISLSNIESNIKKSFIENLILKLKRINLIISKEDIDLILEFKNEIESIFIKDLENNEEYLIIKNKFLNNNNENQNQPIDSENNGFSINNI